MKRVVFELLGDVMTGGVRVSDNFLESEPFIKGSVLRAGFASEILLECPVADVTLEGKRNFIFLKDPQGECAACEKRSICEKFSEMRFSFAYKEGGFPAPFTARACKREGTEHFVTDTIFDTELAEYKRRECPVCRKEGVAIPRIESLKGFVKKNGDGFSSVKTLFCESTHTAINGYSHTSLDGSLFSVRAIKRGQLFSADIDDCGTGLVKEGTIVYVGKYSSCGYGKLRVVSVEDISAVSVKERMQRFKEGYASILFLSDAILDLDVSSEPRSNEQYLTIWNKALFGDNAPVTAVSVYSETTYYSGFDTSREAGRWRDEQPYLLTMKGTSVLMKIIDAEKAVPFLEQLEQNGIGAKTADGYGRIEVCSEIHRMGAQINA